MALFCLVIASCGKSKSEGSSDSYDGPLVGNWVIENDEEFPVQFTSSGTIITVVKRTKRIDERTTESWRYFERGSYKVDGNKLTTIVDGEEETFEFEIQDDVLKVKREDGQTAEFHRITVEKYKELTDGVASSKPED